MEEVRIVGSVLEGKTKSGRPVQVLRSDDGEKWGFKFGPDDDGVSFALSDEAVQIMLSMIFSLTPTGGEVSWVVQLKD